MESPGSPTITTISAPMARTSVSPRRLCLKGVNSCTGWYGCFQAGDDMNITITGATGFIGRRLIERLARDRHQLHALSRRTNVKFGDTAVWISKWDPMTEEPPEESLVNPDAIGHLAGEPAAQRWTADAKKKILESRVQGTRRLVQALSTQSR